MRSVFVGGLTVISQKEIGKMPLTKVTMSRELVEWHRQWFRDIIERHAPTGNIYGMLHEAYLLGMHHCMKVSEKENQPNQP
jgi:hypothetical protein